MKTIRLLYPDYVSGDGSGGGKMTIEKLTEILCCITGHADVVGFSIAEYLPFDEYRLHKMFSKIKFDPKTMIFIPSKIFNRKSYTFSEICEEHFQGRSSKKLRFEYKLWNALQITKVYPSLYVFVGVMWLNDKVIKVHRHYFGNLLKLKRPTSALFNSQGSFPSHGFLELSVDELKREHGIEAQPDDSSFCRYFYHPNGTFSSNSTEDEVLNCRWIRPPGQ